MRAKRAGNMSLSISRIWWSGWKESQKESSLLADPIITRKWGERFHPDTTWCCKVLHNFQSKLIILFSLLDQYQFRKNIVSLPRKSLGDFLTMGVMNYTTHIYGWNPGTPGKYEENTQMEFCGFVFLFFGGFNNSVFQGGGVLLFGFFFVSSFAIWVELCVTDELIWDYAFVFGVNT